MPLVQGPVTVSKVEAVLEAAGIKKPELLKMLANAAAPLVQRKLGELDVQQKDADAVAAKLTAMAQTPAKLKAVFAAAMPLVQGPVTVSKVEAVLEAAGIEKPELLEMLANAAAPLVQRKLGELDVQQKDADAVVAKLTAMAQTPEKLKAVFAAAMPLVQGPVTVAKVEAVLTAVGFDKGQVSAMLVDVAAPPLRKYRFLLSPV
jgi:hypothetical protein